MRRLLPVLLLVLLTALLSGMADIGGSPSPTAPEVEEEFTATVYDRGGTSVELNQFSMEGRVFFEGLHGSGTMTVHFKNIHSAHFGSSADDRIEVELALLSGETVSLDILERTMFYGSTGFGGFQIRARDLQKIEFPQ